MLITFNFDKINLLSLQFLILIINDFLLSLIFYFWYLIFRYNDHIKSPNPLFSYFVMLFYNSIVLYFMIYKNFSIEKILFYFIIFVLWKISSIYYMITFYNLKIDYSSIYLTILIIFTYILFILVINNILLHNDINLIKMIKDSITSTNSHNYDFITIDYYNN
jgi:hypothetical protein